MAEPLSTLIVGSRGSGKTTLAKWLTADKGRLVVLDPLQEYTRGVLYGLDGCLDLLSGPRTRFRAIWRPGASEEPPANDADWLRRGLVSIVNSCAAKAKRDGPLWLLIDESKFFLAGGSANPPEFEMQFRFARHNGLYLILSSHRTLDFGPLVFGHSNLLLCRLEGPNDLAYLSNRFPNCSRVVSSLPLAKRKGSAVVVSFLQPGDGDDASIRTMEVPLELL